ncbi:MAG TPA: copper homeostasis protein CutC [Planctomycetota bacterium]
MAAPFVFEVCVETLDGALAAARGGADRLELCAGLALGGLTPSQAAVELAVVRAGIPVVVLQRPRRGDFVWSPAEVELMERDVELAGGAGARGVAVGALCADGKLDLAVLERLARRAQGLELVHHRAFDHVEGPLTALDELVALGFTRLLTSGQAPTAWTGAGLLRELVEAAAGRLTVMPGGGVRAHNLRALQQATGASEFHFSAGRRVPAPAAPGAARAPMAAGVPPGDHERDETCEATVRACINSLRPSGPARPAARGRADA